MIVYVGATVIVIGGKCVVVMRCHVLMCVVGCCDMLLLLLLIVGLQL